MLDLLALGDFNLVAKYGGFGRAARAAGRPKATLSRRVAELEAALGLRLFERGGHMLKLTEEGRALHTRTGALLTEIDEAAADIAGGAASPRGRLRISAPLLFSQTAMGAIAARFALAYPEVRLEVTAEDRPVDMIEEGYDLAIRVNPDPDESLIGRAFLHDRLLVVAQPGLERGRASVPVVVRDESEAARWAIDTEAGSRSFAVEPVLRLSSLVMVRDAVRTGIGAARLPLSLVAHDLAAGRLVQWGEVPKSQITLWALYPSRRLLSPRVSAFLDFLKASFPEGSPEELAAFVAG